MIRLLLFSAILFCSLTSCWKWKSPVDPPEKMVLGYKPVYSTDTSLLRIVADTAHPVKHAGKIYAFGDLLLQNEIGEGIHVLDITNPSTVKNLGFIRIKGNSEISMKGQYLYANSFTDMLVVDVKDWKNPIEIKRHKNAFSHGSSVTGFYQFIPLPEQNVYYDCTSKRDGFQTGWIKDTISDRNCFHH